MKYYDNKIAADIFAANDERLTGDAVGCVVSTAALRLFRAFFGTHTEGTERLLAQQMCSIPLRGLVQLFYLLQSL